MATINFGGTEENVVMREEFSLEKAREIMNMLKSNFKLVYDQQGSIGKRYYRQDEAGTPFGITVDHQSIKDDTVTVRYRDNQEQDRISINQIKPLIEDSIEEI